MLARRRIQAPVRQTQALHRFSADDVRVDNLFHIRFRHMPIPHGFGIHDHVWPVLTLVQAAGLVGAHASFQPALSQLLFEEFLQPGFGRGIAASTGMPCRTLVPADENVMLELGHLHQDIIRQSSGVIPKGRFLSSGPRDLVATAFALPGWVQLQRDLSLRLKDGLRSR